MFWHDLAPHLAGSRVDALAVSVEETAGQECWYEGEIGAQARQGVRAPPLPAHQLSAAPVQDPQQQHPGQQQGIERIQQPVGRGVAAAGAAEHRGGGAGGPEQHRLHPAAGERGGGQGGGGEQENREHGGRRPREVAEEGAQVAPPAADRLAEAAVHAHPQTRSAEEAGAEALVAQARDQRHVVDRRRTRPSRSRRRLSQAFRRRRMNWPLATAGPAPSAAACQSPRSPSSRAKTAGTRRFSPSPLTSWKPARETRVQPLLRPPRRAPAPAGPGHGGCRRRSTAARASRRPARPPRARGPSPASRPEAGRRRGGSGGAPPRPSSSTRPAVPSVEPSSITRTTGAAVCASSVATQSSTLSRSSRTGRRTVVSGVAGRGGGSGGARRRRSSVLSASPRRPAPRRRERERARLNALRSGGEPLRELGLDLSGHREASLLLLGEDQVVGDDDLEDAATAADQLWLDAELASRSRPPDWRPEGR